MLDFFKEHKKLIIEISPLTIIYVIAAYFSIQALMYIHSIIILIFLAFIIMLALNPFVQKFQKKVKVSRLTSIISVYIIVILFLIIGLSLIIPSLVTELYQLLKNTNLEIPFLQEQLSEFKFSVTELTNLINQLGSSFQTAISLIINTFSGIFTFVTVIVLSFYLLLERPHLHLKLYWFTKDKNIIKKTKKILKSLEEQLGGWVRAELILMTIIGVMTYIGLILLSVPYALPLALCAGLLEILPNLGPTIATVPSLIIASIYSGPVVAIAVIILYIIIQQLENNIIVPRVMKQNADVNPLVSIVSILIGFKVYGVIGGLLAVPSYIIMRTIWSTYFYHKNIPEKPQKTK